MDDNKQISNNDKVSKDLQEKLDSLTEQNWLFLHYIRKGLTVKEAYKCAGYTAKSESAPYALMHRLKGKAELLTELDEFNRLRYMHEVTKLVSMPLSESKKDVTLSEKLRILKLFKTSLPDMQDAPKQMFTQIVINRYNDSGNHGSRTADRVNNAKVVDVEAVDNDVTE